jgi:ribonuclease HI
MLTYSISVYSWPVSLLKDLEKCIRNFIWSGDIEKRKLVTISWHKMCRPLAQGGLNLRSLTSLNTATNLKLCWSLFNDDSSWAKLLRDRVFRKRNIIQHHIFSSIWSSIKEEFAVIRENSVWILGNGRDINFWQDSWCGKPLVEQLHIPHQIGQSLSSTVSDFLHNGQWILPPQLSLMFSNLRSIIHNVVIPLEDFQDKLLWKHSDSGALELKHAYSFKVQQFQDLQWAKLIWIPDIPPSKALLVWRLMHQKVPTDENLMIRGCSIPSMCNLCSCHSESSFHLFFECAFAVKLWSWLAGCLNMTIQFSCMEDMWKLCDLNWSPQAKVTVTAAITNLLNSIWFVRNQARFHDKIITWRSALAMIISNTSLSGNNTTKHSSNSIRDFTFLKIFRVSIHHPKVPVLKEVYWQPPVVTWIKCNIDGASNGNPGLSSCGGIFRDHEANFIFAFAEPLGLSTSYVAELCGAMRAIEIAHQKHWQHLWLETDSKLVVEAFKNPNKPVAWQLSNRWKNTMFMFKQLNCVVTHIYREGNQAADSLANHGLSINTVVFWEESPLFISDYVNRNKLGIPSFRLCAT